MSKSVNILGEAPKEQWLDVILYREVTISAHAEYVLKTMDGLCDRVPRRDNDECEECGRCRSLETVVKQTKNFADEMRRLVNGVFE